MKWFTMVTSANTFNKMNQMQVVWSKQTKENKGFVKKQRNEQSTNIMERKDKKSTKNKECKSAKRSKKLTTDRITFFSFIFLKISFRKIAWLLKIHMAHLTI